MYVFLQITKNVMVNWQWSAVLYVKLKNITSCGSFSALSEATDRTAETCNVKQTLRHWDGGSSTSPGYITCAYNVTCAGSCQLNLFFYSDMSDAPWRLCDFTVQYTMLT